MPGRSRHRQIRRLQLPTITPRTVAEGLLIAAVFFCPLALGTVPPGAIGIMLGLTIGAALWLCWNERQGAFPLPLVGAAFFGLTLYIGLQCLPLPMALLRVLSPQAAGSYSFSLEGLPEAAGFHPLSLDGPATGRELAKALAYAAAFLVAYQLAVSRRARRRLAISLALSALAIAVIGYGHRLLGLGQLFGRPVYEAATPRFVTTFGNSNNAAGLFVLCAPIALGLALRSREGNKRLLWGLCYLLVGAAVVLTVSRGGLATLVLGQIVFGVLTWRAMLTAQSTPAPAVELPSSRSRARIAATLIAIGAVLAVGGYLGFQPVAERVAEVSSLQQARHTGKLVGFLESLGMIRDFPLTGIGRGAFATAGGRYLSFAQTAEYVEDEPIQLLVDLGIPIAAALLAILVMAFIRAGRAGRGEALGPVELGLWVGLLSLGVQNLADFSLELGGVALPAVIALAILLGGQAREEAEAQSVASPVLPERSWQRFLLPQLRWGRAGRGVTDLRLPAWSFVAFLVAALPLGIWGLLNSSPDWRVETDRFGRLAPFLDGDGAAKAAGPVLARHPASYVVPLAVADRYLHDRIPAQALIWANRAMYFKRELAIGHLIGATSLAELGRKDQALIEGRLYYQLAPGNTEALRSLARFYPAVDDLRRVVDDTGQGLLGLAEFLRGRSRFGDAARVAELAVAASPEDPAIQVHAAQVLTATGQVDEAETDAQRAIELAPDQPGGYLALENARAAAGDLQEAQVALEEGLRALPAQDSLVLGLVRLQLSMGHADKAEASLKQLGPQGGEQQRAQLFALQGEIYAREGRTVKAEDAYRNAVRVEPGPRYAWTLVQLLEGESKLSAALQVLQELRTSAGEDQRSAIDRRIAQEQQALSASESKAKTQEILNPRP